MSSRKQPNISLRFTKSALNEEDLLEEVLDSYSEDDSSVDWNRSSRGSTPSKESVAEPKPSGKSLDSTSEEPSSSRQWLVECRKKFNQIIEERKEKRKEKEKTGDETDGEGEEEEKGEGEEEKESVNGKEEVGVEAIESLVHSSSNIVVTLNDDDHKKRRQSLPPPRPPPPRPPPVRLQSVADDEDFAPSSVTSSAKASPTSDQPIEQRPDRVSPPKEVADANNIPWAQAYYIFSLSVLVAAIGVVTKSPLPSFINGLLFGLLLCASFVSFVGFILFDKFFVKKKEWRKKRNVLEFVSESEEVGKDQETIYKEWMYEMTSKSNAKESRDGNEAKEGTKLKRQLMYVRLQGNSLRLSQPKGKPSKKKQLTEGSSVTFISQRIFDLGKMRHKKISLLLPKNIRNQKKYLFSKKYPIQLELEDVKNPGKTVKVVLFVRTCREKEEWFWRLKKTICDDEEEERDGDPMAKTGPPPSPRDGNVEGKAKETLEHIPRAQSFDFSQITYKGQEELKVKGEEGADGEGKEREKEKKVKGHPTVTYEMYMNSILGLKEGVELRRRSPADDSASLLWFNALLGRVFFDFLTHRKWKNWVSAKIQRKLSRLKLPYFMQTLTLKEIDLGQKLPSFIGVPAHPSLDSKGLWVHFTMSYSGGFTMTLETKLNLMKFKGETEMKPMRSELLTETSSIDSVVSDDESIVASSSEDESEEKDNISIDVTSSSGKQEKLLKFVDKITSSSLFQSATENKYIKRAMEEVSNTPLVLTVRVNQLEGTLAINIPPPPSDRLWYGFREEPNLVLEARPRLGDHIVSFSQVTDWIEKRLQEEFNKVLVMPHMDDLVLGLMVAKGALESVSTTIVP